jgi:GT2 family glycosyltransferase
MQKSNLPLVSIVTLNWNTPGVTRDFLCSIKEKNTYENIEVIVVDNGSGEDFTSLFQSSYPGVKVILTGKNLGFSGGNNVGIKVAKGDFVFIVNNDTEITPGIIEGLLDIFDHYPDCGMVSPKFHYFFQKDIIEYAGYESVNIFTGRNGMIGWEKDEGQYNEVKKTNYAHGGAMMVSRKVLEEVGLMYEPFFLYYEELDWCTQIKRKGYNIYYQPKSLIYHKESMTTGKASPLKTFYLTRNRILFMRRNAPLLGLLIFLVYFVCFTIPKNTIRFLFKRQKGHLRSFWKGIMWHFNKKITFN